MNGETPPRVPLTPELLARVAERFQALAEPARLQILDALRDGERTVGELVEATGLGQANVSKHLQLLHRRGFVAREKEGLFVRYRLGDPDIVRLCDIMCRRLTAETSEQNEVVPRHG